MLFNSLHYLIFLPVVAALYFALPHKWRWLLLLVASYYFYMCWKPEYIVLLLISTGIAYAAGLGIASTDSDRTRRIILWACIALLLGILFIFKYFNFAATTARHLFSYFAIPIDVPFLNVLLPVGISFYTFQKISYVVDVFYGKTEAERNPRIFAIYSCFFPQLVAGPIERAPHLLPQFYDKHQFCYERVVSGLRLILWGFFKKVAVADRLAILVQGVYSDPRSYSGFPLIVATVFFAFQIYCDFSGYSDIAIGSARILGFDLIINFRQPYFSKSISEFWQRWHISLSTWFRDYVFFPLEVANRKARNATLRVCVNVFVTMLLCGLWHGASWNFVLWGALHGGYMIPDSILARRREVLRAKLKARVAQIGLDWVNVALTFCLVGIAWIPFRANNFNDAWYIFTHLFSDARNWLNLGTLALRFRGMGLNLTELTFAIVFVLIVIIYDVVDIRGGFWKFLEQRPRYLRWAVYYGLLILVLFFSPYNKAQNFIYFQF